MLLGVVIPIKLGHGGRFEDLVDKHPHSRLTTGGGPTFPSLSRGWTLVGVV